MCLLIPVLLGVGTLGFSFAAVSDFWLAPGIAFLGAMTGAVLSEWTDPRAVFAVAAAAKLLEVIIALVTPIRKL